MPILTVCFGIGFVKKAVTDGAVLIIRQLGEVPRNVAIDAQARLTHPHR